eukprot:1159128-Pelagomonas_calceolata.AAC.3
MALANWKVRPPSLWMARIVAVSQPLLPHFTHQVCFHWSAATGSSSDYLDRRMQLEARTII